MPPGAPPPAFASLVLRDVTQDDLPLFFEHQADPEACRMCVFTVKDPTDRAAFDARWAKHLAIPEILVKTIVVDGRVAGHVASFMRNGVRGVSYWLGREFWGRGIASAALARLLADHEPVRPLYGRAARSNLASVRVLQKCGFRIVGEDKGISEGTGLEVEEFVLALPPAAGGAVRGEDGRPGEDRT
jgi:RimJ/RimL family protein N-acetyltransferase